MLRCTACHRVLLVKPAATVRVRGSESQFGPKCAERLGLLPPKKRRTVVVPRSQRAKATPQVDWIAEVAAA